MDARQVPCRAGGGSWRWQWQRDTIWRDGQILAAVSSNPSAVERHYTVDHLGTPRLLTDAHGVVASRHRYFPFGEEATDPFADNGRQTDEVHRFTGHERDLVDGAATTDDLDYMHARYYGPIVGRFLSVDSGPLSAHAPQSLSRYTYVLGRPLANTDPTGNCVWDVCVGEAYLLVVAASITAIAIHAYMESPSSLEVGKTIGEPMSAPLGSLLSSRRRGVSPEQREATMSELARGARERRNAPKGPDAAKILEPLLNPLSVLGQPSKLEFKTSDQEDSVLRSKE